MIVQIFNSVMQAVSWVWRLFFQLINYFGAGGLLFSLFVFAGVVRFLLRPLFGVALTDTAYDVVHKIKGKGRFKRSGSSKKGTSKSSKKGTSKSSK